MDLTRFRERVFREFGHKLEKATPDNVEQFLAKVQKELTRPSGGKRRFEIDEPSTSYEEMVREFFARVFTYPTEQAIIILWMMAFELSFAAIKHQYAERFATLFGDEENK